MLKLLISRCTRCSKTGAYSDHFLLHINRKWSPLLPTEIAARRGIGPEAARVAAEANRRLHAKAERLRRRGMAPSKANVAVARELAGFVWVLAGCEG